MIFKKYKLKDLLTIKNGRDYKKLGDGCYPVYGTGGYMRSVDKFLYNDTSILLPRKGSLNNVQYIEKSPFWTVDTLFYTIINKDICNPYYLYLYLKQIDFNMFNSGASIPSMTTKIYYSLNILLPDLKIQTRIADILRQYDYLIENNNKRIKILEQMAENLYKEWFVRFRFPGYENVEYENKVPGGWIVSNIHHKNLVPTIFKYDKLSKLGKFIRGRNLTASEMVEGNISVISAGLNPSGYHNEANVYGKSLTISASGANAGYLKYNLEDIWAADCSYFQDGEKIWYIYNTLKFLQVVITNFQVGSAQPHVYPKHLNNLNILIPTDDLLKKYHDIVSSYYDEILLLTKKNKLLVKQRDLLLPRLMSGKLKV